MACLLAQQKLQLDYKTNITQISQKIKLYGIPTSKKLKKPHSSRRGDTRRGAERWKGEERCGDTE